MNKKQTVVITGATGFVGKYLVKEGADRGFRVIGLTRNIEKAKNESLVPTGFAQVNLLDTEALRKLLKEINPDFFIHNAGVTKLTMHAGEDYKKGNLEVTRSVLQALDSLESKPRKVIFSSSLEAAGPGDPDTLLPKTVADERPPVTLYGLSKLLAEKEFEKFSLPYIIFRPTAIYGPFDRGLLPYYNIVDAHLEPYFIHDKQRISLVYVKDLVRLYYDALHSDISGRKYFVSDGNIYTIAEFAAMVKKILHKSTVKLIFPKFALTGISMISEIASKTLGAPNFFPQERLKQLSQLNWACDISDTIRDFNYKPRYTLEEGLRETLDWFKQNPEKQKRQ